MRPVIALALPAVLALASCGGGGQQQSGSSSGGSSPSPAADNGPSLASAPASFAMCTSCHTIKPGIHAVGPSLFGVFGRKAATAEGYAYSDAMKASGKTWDEATLDTYLTAPMKEVPGTKMTFAGMSDPAKRKEVIGFLKTVK